MGARIQVDLKTYVERVVINEWGPNEMHRAQLLSAAQVVKQYAWWYITHPSKKLQDVNGECFDIGSSTDFQLYRDNATEKQEKADAARIKKGLPARLPLIRSAIEAIWPLSIWKTSGANKGFAHTGYLAGRYRKGCAKFHTGFQLFQQNARRCARNGESFEALIRRVYGPNVGIYSPSITAEDPTGILAAYEPDPFAESWSLPDGWSNGDDQLTEFRGDYDGDLFPEIATLRVWNTTDEATGHAITSATMGSIERRNGAYFWRNDIWSVADLGTYGIDATKMSIISADLNGDGAGDLIISAPAPSGKLVPHSAQTAIWVALSKKRRWVKKRIQDPVLGAPQLVASSRAALSDITFTLWDHDADGHDELALLAAASGGGLELSLLSVPRNGGVPSLSIWWTSNPALGAYNVGSATATPQPLGPRRDPTDGRRALRSELLIQATIGESSQTIAVSGAARGVAEAR
jgi:hypothetical protein